MYTYLCPEKQMVIFLALSWVLQPLVRHYGLFSSAHIKNVACCSPIFWLLQAIRKMDRRNALARAQKKTTKKNRLFHLRVLYWTQTEERKQGRPGNKPTLESLPVMIHTIYTLYLLLPDSAIWSLKIKNQLPETNLLIEVTIKYGSSCQLSVHISILFVWWKAATELLCTCI